MEIAGTIISDEEIIGISHLRMFNPTLATAMAKFSVYTKGNSVPIQSDVVSVHQQDEAQSKLLEFQMMYIKAYKEICILLGEYKIGVFPKYISDMNEQVQELWTENKIKQQSKDN